MEPESMTISCGSPDLPRSFISHFLRKILMNPWRKDTRKEDTMSGHLFFITVISSLFFSFANLDAQVDTVWVKYFGTDGWDSAEEVQQTRDGGYVICGVAGNDVIHNSNLYLIRTDSAGRELWTKLIEGSESRTYGTSVQETKDGGFILTGHKEWDIYLAKTNSEGEIEWSRTFGSPRSADCGSMVRQTPDGGYIVTGYTGSYARGGEGDYDAFLLKTDELGKPEWKRTYGEKYMEQGFTVELTSDGGYFVCGYTYSPSGGNFADVYLIKTDSSGVVEWESVIGGWNTDVGRSAQKTSDGGFIVTGRTRSFGAGNFDVYLLKVDASGDTVWTNTFGGTGDDAAFSVVVSRDQGEEVYTITGKTDSFGDGDYDLYLLRVDADGNLIWEWTFGDDRFDEIGRWVIHSNDGGLVIAGDFGSFLGEFFDIFLMKVRLEAGVGLSIQPVDRTTLFVGEILEFRSTITNHTDHVVEGDFWLSIVLPEGTNIPVPDGLISLPGLVPVRIFPSSTLELVNALWIHPRSETGTYRLVGKLGLYPDSTIEKDAFEYEVIE